MIDVRQTEIFREWILALRDRRAIVRIGVRIGRLRQGNFGDVKSIGDGVSELRIDYGPGYRVYFTRRGERIVLLLCGGDKGGQSHDIARAKALATDLKG